MNKLNQQLEDKKKELKELKTEKKEIEDCYDHCIKLNEDWDYLQIIDKINKLEAEIAILEQAIAILEQAIAEIKNIQSQREMKKDDRGTDMQISPNSVVDKTLLSNPADISNLLQKQRQELLTKIENYHLLTRWQWNDGEVYVPLNWIKKQLNQPKTE